MGWAYQPDEIIVSTNTKAGHVRAEYTGTFVDIFARDTHVDAFRPPVIIESPGQLRALLKRWIRMNDIPALIERGRSLTPGR